MGRQLAFRLEAQLTMRKRGFTIPELLMATFILVFSAAGTFLLLGSTSQFTSHRTLRYEAFEYASQTLDTLKDYVTEDTPNTIYRLTGDVHNCSGPSSGYALIEPAGAWEHCHPLPPGTFRDRFGGRRRYTVEDVDLDFDGDPDIKRVTVTINWTEAQ